MLYGQKVLQLGQDIGGGLDEHHAQMAGFGDFQIDITEDNQYEGAMEDMEPPTYPDNSARWNYESERKFYEKEAHENITIKKIIGKTIPVVPSEGLLPDEEFYMDLDFPIIFGSGNPQGTMNGTTTTYEGEFGKIVITNGTLVDMPDNKTIMEDGSYRYTIRINTGDLSSNMVDIDVTKYWYEYKAEIGYSKCENNDQAQPVGYETSITRPGGPHEGVTVHTKGTNLSFRINSDVAIKHYIHSIGGEDHYNRGSMMAHSGIGGRKAWDTNTKLSQPAVGELGDEIIYKIIIENYTKANIYVNIEDILPAEATFVSATHGGNGNPVNWKLVRMDEANSPTSPGNPTPNTKEITLIARMNIANYGKAISTAKIVKVFATNAETYDMKNVAKSRFNRIEEDQDAFTTKKYDISIDQYIAQVNHQETRGGTGVTYSSNARERKDNDWKLGDPVFVEYGDVITYKFVLYNTNYNVTNGATPWFNPDTVTVDLNFELPKRYTLRSISSTDSYNSYRENGNKVEFSKVRIGRNSTTTIILTLAAEEVRRDTTETTTLLLTEVYNRNGRNIHEANPIQNTSSRTEVKEQYKISHYDAILDEYIFTYNAEMAKYNDNYEFSTDESNEAFIEQERTYSNTSPLNIEKYETLCYKTVITNNYTNAEKENTQASYKRYNTRIRPTLVRQAIDYGLTQYKYEIYWHHASSGKDELVSYDENQSRIIQTLNDTGSQWVYEYEILDEEIILSPGDYLYYLSYVEVTESNLCLKNLAFYSEIITLTNINRKNQYKYQIWWHHASTGKDELVGSNSDQSRISQTLRNSESEFIYTYRKIDGNIVLEQGDYLYYVALTKIDYQCKTWWHHDYSHEIGRQDEEEQISFSGNNGEISQNLNNIRPRLVYTYDIIEEYMELPPRDYLYYVVSVKNLSVGKDTRIVTKENIAIQANHVSRTNFVRLKDLIICGTVWIDENRDGYSQGENGKNNVKVSLYSNYYSDRKNNKGEDVWEYHDNNYKKIAETYTRTNRSTNSDGYYNFGRIDKASKYENGNYSSNEQIKYFVEFEYYGQMYKATEVYGGMADGETRGTGNLSIGNTASNNTIYYWRQGYNKLPQSESEKIIHAKDLGLDRKNRIYDRLKCL